MKYYTFTIQTDENAISLRDILIKSEMKRCIFDADRLICEDQVILATQRADRAFQNGVNIANNWGIEVILHLAGQHQISTAIELLGISEKTKRIGIIQQEDKSPSEYAERGLSIKEVSSELIERYGISDTDPCGDIVAKGVVMIADHE